MTHESLSVRKALRDLLAAIGDVYPAKYGDAIYYACEALGSADPQPSLSRAREALAECADALALHCDSRNRDALSRAHRVLLDLGPESPRAWEHPTYAESMRIEDEGQAPE